MTDDLDLEMLWIKYVAAMNEAIASARAGKRDEMAFYIGTARMVLDTYFAVMETYVEHNR